MFKMGKSCSYSSYNFLKGKVVILFNIRLILENRSNLIIFFFLIEIRHTKLTVQCVFNIMCFFVLILRHNL